MKLIILFLSVFIPGLSLAMQVQIFQTDYTDLIQVNNKIIGLDADGKAFQLTVELGRINAIAFSLSNDKPRPDDILSDGVVVKGRGQIRKAWLGGPTDHYDHGVLANTIEASRLYAVDANNKTYQYELKKYQVFEDRFPRFADIDGDGQDELIVIRTDIESGAGLASYGLNDGRLTLEAASETIGLSHRWMNIVGIEDFNGDGKAEIAAVITPHIGGTLALFQQRGKNLVPVLKQYGFSNHQNGSREMGMSAALDINGDGIKDMAVPDARRQDLILLTVKNDRFKVLGIIKNAKGIGSGLYVTNIDADINPELVYLLKNGMLVVINIQGTSN